MKRFITHVLQVFSIVVALLLPGTLTPTTVSAAPLPGESNVCETTFLTFPTWHAGIRKDSNCRLLITNINQIWIIGFNILNIAVQIAAYAAVAIIFAMLFKMLTARGDPGKISSAAMGIRNAIIGLVIALISIAIVNFITTSLERVAS